MEHTDQTDPFLRSLATSLALAERLEGLLQEETTAILGRQTDDIQRVVTVKQGIVAELEAQTHKQARLVGAAGHPFVREGVVAYFATRADRQGLQALWERLRRQVAKCDNINQHNGRLIERDRRRVATSLQILRGDDGAAATYSPSGQADPAGHRSHIISSA